MWFKWLLIEPLQQIPLCSSRWAALRHACERWPRCCTARSARACRRLNPARTTAWTLWRAAWPTKLIWIQSGTNTSVSYCKSYSFFSPWIHLLFLVLSIRRFFFFSYSSIHVVARLYGLIKVWRMEVADVWKITTNAHVILAFKVMRVSLPDSFNCRFTPAGGSQHLPLDCF